MGGGASNDAVLLTSFIVKSSHEIDQVMQAGKKNRSVGATLMNAGSSRSHAIFTIHMTRTPIDATTADGETKADMDVEGADAAAPAEFTESKLNLVDLAGSERANKTKATGEIRGDLCVFISF